MSFYSGKTPDPGWKKSNPTRFFLNENTIRSVVVSPIVADERVKLHFRSEFAMKSHEAILQTLNRSVDGRYLTAESFSNVDSWKGTKLVFAYEHPDFEVFTTDSAKALEKVKGREVGVVGDAWIDTIGHPKLMARLDITDAQLEADIKDGKVSLSTGFYAHLINDQQLGMKVNGAVEPNHVLLFYEDQKNLPRDLGTGILNKRTEGTQDNARQADLDQSKPEINQQEVKNLAELEELNAKVSALESAIEGEKLEIANKDSEIATLKSKLAAFEAKAIEAEWAAVMNKLPEGLKKSDADKTAMRNLWDSDKTAFSMKIVEFFADAPRETGRTGVEHIANKKDVGEVPDGDKLRSMGVPSIEFVDARVIAKDIKE